MVHYPPTRSGILMPLMIALCLLLNCTTATAQPAGYAYGKRVSIQASRISGSQTNYPVLISVTDPDLRTVANGGRVRSGSGYDILFTLADGVTVLSLQIEKYVALTGQYVAWVKVPAISSSSNTILGMYYGKAGVGVNPSTTAVWDANYMGVWHFNLSVTDGTSNARTLTNVGTTNFAGSIIGDGRQLNNNPFVASSSGACKYLQLPNNILGAVSNFTFEGWVYLDDNTTSWERVFDFGQSTTVNMFLTSSITTNGIKRFSITSSGNAGEQQTSSAATTGMTAWHHFVVTLDNTSNTSTLYFDGAVDATNTGVTLRPSNMSVDNANYFGKSQYAADNCLYGKFDEFRLSNIVRSTNWVQTSYNNQVSPTTFTLMGAEMSAVALMATLPVSLRSFSGSLLQDQSVQLVWVTETEKNNRQFIVERSADGNSWETYKTVAAGGNGVYEQQYMEYDKNPYYPVTYYRLSQVDIDGNRSYLGTVAVRLSSILSDNLTLYPNPAGNHVIATLKNTLFTGAVKIKLTDYLGRTFNAPFRVSGNALTLQTGGLPQGAYLLAVYANGSSYAQKLVVAH